jgi:1-deoxy-D-xylulose-5-phosphate synthase
MISLKELRSPSDLKGLTIPELTALCGELRTALLRKLSAHGGHIGPNLGMVEATVALHYVFHSPTDKLVFDVSHQSYVHKMLTGRIDAFLDPSKYDDVSGYSEPSESEHDHFIIGHTSTSVSLAGGMAVARDLTGGHENIIAIIGDGSLSGGEALEGLDFAGTLRSNFIIVVNDNDMSIAENHGGLYDNLQLLRRTEGRAECNLFRAMGLDYRFVKDGNDMAQLVDAFRSVRDIDHPVVVHICTLKGKGFLPAETHKEEFHWGMPFDLTTGEPLQTFSGESYDDLFATHMMQMAAHRPEVAVLTAGTPGVLAFGPERRRQMGRQFIDVGIAEQEAVALASGMAKRGARPCFGVVSSFIQRAYDQLSQDVAVNATPVVLNIFYGSVLGMNDVTHLGWFDIALIANIPGWVFLAPTTKEEYLAMLDWAMTQTEHPVAVRMPGGAVVSTGQPVAPHFELNRYEVVKRGSQVAIMAAGTFFGLGQAAVAELQARGIDATLVNPRFLSGVDTALLDSLKADHQVVLTLEDGVLDGGFGEKIARHYADSAVRVKCYGLEKRFLDRYDASQLLEACRLRPQLLADDAVALLAQA